MRFLLESQINLYLYFNSVFWNLKLKVSFFALPAGHASGSTNQNFTFCFTFLIIFAASAHPSSLQPKLLNLSMPSFVQKVSTAIAKHLLGTLEELSHKETGCDIFLVADFSFGKKLTQKNLK
jgi:hypothetical protein